MKFFKRLFVFLLFLLITGAATGYYYGLRPDNYEQFFQDLEEEVMAYLDKKDQPISEPDGDSPVVGKQPDNYKPVPKKQRELQPLPFSPFAKVDQHARAWKKGQSADIPALAAYLEKGAKTDLEKSRAIYTWLTKNVSYDDRAFNTGVYGDLSAQGVFESGKAVCEGFSNLYWAIGEDMGLEIEKIVGYAKGYGFTPGDKFADTDHAWNRIKINGEWRVFDATWGEGYGKTVNGQLKSFKAFDPYWFNVDPYEAIFTHLPEKVKQRSIEQFISVKQYEQMPYIEASYFKLGFDGKNALRKATERNTIEFPMAYPPKTYVKVIKAPRYKKLFLAKSYAFEINVPRAYEVVLIDGNNTWTQFEGEKGVFTLQYEPKTPGEVHISIKFKEGGESFQTILIYKAVKNGVIS